jgi:ribosomal protein S18 acetylase RimI-like enzyme
MTHYLFNFSGGDRQRAAVLLRAKMWGVGRDERHRDALAPGDLALIYVAAPAAEFIGRAELATAVHDWTPSEAEAYRDDSPSGVLLSDVEEWDPAVPMDTVVQRIDPTASNPLVQTNAAAGFGMGVVRITPNEYETALALSRKAGGTPQIVLFSSRHLDGVVQLCVAEGWPSWTHESTAQAFAAPGVIAVVAEEDGEVLGVAELLTDGQLTAYLGMLVVAERARRRGIGRALIDDLFERSGLRRMDLLSEEGAIPFYESMPNKAKPGFRLYRHES